MNRKKNTKESNRFVSSKCPQYVFHCYQLPVLSMRWRLVDIAKFVLQSTKKNKFTAECKNSIKFRFQMYDSEWNRWTSLLLFRCCCCFSSFLFFNVIVASFAAWWSLKKIVLFWHLSPSDRMILFSYPNVLMLRKRNFVLNRTITVGLHFLSSDKPQTQKRTGKKKEKKRNDSRMRDPTIPLICAIISKRIC